ncbi:MAG: SGNH/GDSL hydrolase family protein [Verrucomicrobiales bacterium]
MRSFFTSFLALLGFCPALSLFAQAPVPSAARLTLPPQVFAVEGSPMKIDLRNTVLAAPERIGGLEFEVICPVGAVTGQQWKLTATSAEVGTHSLQISVKDAAGHLLGKERTTLRISPADSGKGGDAALLILGDSLTHASLYPNELARLLSGEGNPTWRMLGTHHPAGAAEGVFHEGYGGWTWNRFQTLFDPKAPEPGKVTSSPFLFPPANAGAAPVLDLPRYFKERCAGQLPDYLIIMLGINDCFRANPDDLASIDSTVDAMLKEAETLLAKFKAAAPQADIGLCLTTPGNDRDGAFVANYQDKYTRWGWRRIQHRLVERQIQAFRGREKDRMFIIPTELNLDCTAGYPENNGVHPNATGYAEIGSSIYAWLKSRFALRSAER